MLVADALLVLDSARRKGLPLPGSPGRRIGVVRDEAGLHVPGGCEPEGERVGLDLDLLSNVGRDGVCGCLGERELPGDLEKGVELLEAVTDALEDAERGRDLVRSGDPRDAWRGVARMTGAAHSLTHPRGRREVPTGLLGERAQELRFELEAAIREATALLDTPEGEAALVELVVAEDVPERPWTELDSGAIWVAQKRVPAWPANLVRPALLAWAREVRRGKGVEAAERAARTRIRELSDLDVPEAEEKHLTPALLAMREWFAPDGERRLVALGTVLPGLGFGRMGAVNLAVLRWGVATHTERRSAKAVVSVPESVARALCGRTAHGCELGSSEGADRETLETMLALWDERDREGVLGAARNAYTAAQGVHSLGTERKTRGEESR